MSQILMEKEAAIVEAIAACNKALAENDAAKLKNCENNLKEAESAYTKAKMDITFDECKGAENPMIAAVTKHSIEVIGHKVVTEDGAVIGYERVDDKIKQIDLVKFCKWIEAPTLWQYKVEKLGFLLCLRVAKDIGLTAAEVAKISDSYWLDEKAKELEMGGTPTSNTQVCKLLQTVIDAILFVDDGKGGNKFKCNSHDVAYMDKVYSRRSKQILTVRVAKTSFVHAIVADVLHRIVTGKKYGVDGFRVKKDAESKPAEAKPVKGSEAPKTVVYEPEQAEPIVIEKVPVA